MPDACQRPSVGLGGPNAGRRGRASPVLPMVLVEPHARWLRAGKQRTAVPLSDAGCCSRRRVRLSERRAPCDLLQPAMKGFCRLIIERDKVIVTDHCVTSGPHRVRGNQAQGAELGNFRVAFDGQQVRPIGLLVDRLIRLFDGPQQREAQRLAHEALGEDFGNNA